jgi:hypothetical protein
MLFSKHPKSIDSLLFKLGQAEKLAQAAERQDGYDPSSSFFMIFSVQDVVDFKNDSHKLIRRLSTLCVVLTSCVAAGVAVWLLYVLRQ